MVVLLPVVISNGLRAERDKLGIFSSHWPPPQPPTAASVHFMHIHIFNKVAVGPSSVKTVNAKTTKKSPIHENADANITCDFGDSDIIMPF